MTDQIKNRPLIVHDGGVAGPYMSVPLDQLKAVESLLQAHDIRYWVDREALSIDGAPYRIYVNFGRGIGVSDLQPLFDAVE